MSFSIGQDQLEELKESAQAISRAINKTTPRINEKDFVANWLHKLMHSTDEGTSRDWITRVSLTPFDKVNIVDDSGNVVATVPAFCASTGKYIRSEFNLSEYMATISNASNLGKTARVNQLFEGLFSQVQKNPFPIEDLTAWVKLAEHFEEKPVWLQGFKDLIEKYKSGNNKDVKTTKQEKKDNDDYTDFEPV